jgi:hypothetical protein
MAQLRRRLDGGVALVVVKRVLMIAFQYPPVAGSSGVHRVRSFVKYLPEHGWEPIVLTVRPSAYPRKTDQPTPSDAIVVRAPCLDAVRHLSIGGKGPPFLRWPDRWSTWWLTGVPAGLRLIKRYEPDVLWSTYPTATAHLIGLTLQRLTGVAWLADFRDSMTEPHYPTDPRVRAIFRWIERRTVARASAVAFTAPGTVRMYAQRYPDRAADFWHWIANGYDEAAFPAAPDVRRGARDRRLSLLHAGILYPSERDPRPFFSALASLKRAGIVSATSLRIKLRATGHDAVHRGYIEERDIADIVELLPIVPHEVAVAEMMNEDGLLLFQAANCNHQIPAKLYEYVRTRRPVLALTDPRGDTASTLRTAGIDTIVDIDDESAIGAGLQSFLERLRDATAPTPSPQVVETFSRRARTAELARLLDRISEACHGRRAGPGIAS